MGIIESKLMMSDIFLKPTVVITNYMYRNKAVRILKKAKAACLTTRSIKSKIIMETIIQI
jgi:hypothetical protein